MLEELNTTNEVASHLRVSPFTVSAWLSQGKLRRTKAAGRTLIARADVEAFIRDSSAAPPSVGRRRGKRTPALPAGSEAAGQSVAQLPTSKSARRSA